MLGLSKQSAFNKYLNGVTVCQETYKEAREPVSDWCGIYPRAACGFEGVSLSTFDSKVVCSLLQ